MKRLARFVLLTSIAATVAYFFKNSRFFTHTVKYSVRRKDGPFEIREYPALKVAKTAMKGEADTAFNRLFQFIQGANSVSEKIAMTTPVLMEGLGRETMCFIMPESNESQQALRPTEDSVLIDKRPGGTFAAYRYTGPMSIANEQSAFQKLGDWLRMNDCRAEGEPVAAYFDPPWMPDTLRRNEIMVRIKMPQ
ncbi:MAG: heme-binding protein [Verrucomicrobia bacterium]|nr:heme-binding protein [Verrucomicrobiota bacterium]